MISLKKTKTDNVDMIKCCRGYLEKGGNYQESEKIISNINQQRKKATHISKYVDSSSISDIEEYCCSLLSMIEAYPVDSPINFKWTGSNGSSVKTDSLLVELACNLYNIVALISQDVASPGTNFNDPENLSTNEKKLEKAYAIVTYIIKNLSFSFGVNNALPELNIENLKSVKEFIHAEIQYLKVMKAIVCHPNTPSAYVALYTASSDLYKRAYDNFARAKSKMPQEFIDFCKAMSDYCHALALYYEGYMTDEELQDTTKHGRGKAFRCMTTYFEITESICRSSNKLVVSIIVPLIKSAKDEMKEKQRKICDSWRFNRSMIPATTEGFHLKPYVYKLNETFPYKPSVDLKLSIGAGPYQTLTTLQQMYQEYTKTYMDCFEKECQVLQKQIDSTLKSLHVVAYESTFSNSVVLPKGVNEMLKSIDNAEAEVPLDTLKTRFHTNKQVYQACLNSTEECYNTTVMTTNLQPQAYSQEVRQYIRNFNHYIEGKKTAFDKIQRNETLPFFALNDGFMSFLFETRRNKLLEVVRKNTIPLNEKEESAFNHLTHQHMKIDLLKIAFQEDIEYIHHLRNSDRGLRKDLMNHVPMETIQKSFDRYMALFVEESKRILDIYRDCTSHFAEMRKTIEEVEQEIKVNQCLENKLKLFKTLFDRADAYHQMVEYYKAANEEMEHNIEGLNQAKMLMNNVIKSVN